MLYCNQEWEVESTFGSLPIFEKRGSMKKESIKLLTPDSLKINFYEKIKKNLRIYIVDCHDEAVQCNGTFLEAFDRKSPHGFFKR